MNKAITLILITCCIIAASCKKSPADQKLPVAQPADMYTGTHVHTEYIEYQYKIKDSIVGYHWDTSYSYQDTMFISKLGADSISVEFSNPQWRKTTGRYPFHFLYVADGQYRQEYEFGVHEFGDLRIDMDTPAHVVVKGTYDIVSQQPSQTHHGESFTAAKQ